MGNLEGRAPSEAILKPINYTWMSERNLGAVRLEAAVVEEAKGPLGHV